MTEQLVTLEVTGSSTVIRLNRPARHNALVPELLVELLDAVNDARSQRARTLILAAEGRSFSTGGDLLGFWQHRDNIAEYAQHLVRTYRQHTLATEYGYCGAQSGSGSRTCGLCKTDTDAGSD